MYSDGPEVRQDVGTMTAGLMWCVMLCLLATRDRPQLPEDSQSEKRARRWARKLKAKAK